MTIINPTNIISKHDICHVLQICHQRLKYLHIIKKQCLWFMILLINNNSNIFNIWSDIKIYHLRLVDKIKHCTLWQSANLPVQVEK